MSRGHRSIGQVLSLLVEEHPDLTISKIRFLESQGLITPERTPSGYRKFFDADIERLRWVLVQQRDRYLPLKEIKRRLDEAPGILEESSMQVGRGAPPGEPARPVVDIPASRVSRSQHPPRVERGGGEANDVPSVDALPGSDLVDADGESASDDAESVCGGGRSAAPVPLLFAARDAGGDAGRNHDRGSAARAAAGGTPSEATGRASRALLSPPSASQFGASGSFTAAELARAMNVDTPLINDLARMGLIIPVGSNTVVGESEPVFDHEALLMVRAVMAFAALGVPARNLRMYRVAADREAGIYEQVVATLIARGDRERLRRELAELVDLAETMRRALLRRLLGPYLD